MNKNLLISAAMLLAGGIAVTSADAASPMHFGFAPADASLDDSSSQGSGRNNYIEAVIRLSPSEYPELQALKGSKVTGIRCRLRTEYRNPTGKKFSAISAYQGSLDAEPVRQTVHFAEGWNEFSFDEPFVLGDEDLYVGYQVFELQGSPHPILSYKPAYVPGSYYINLNRQGWQTFDDKGALQIEAIIEPESSPAPAALATVCEHPLIVAPETAFDGKIYIRNLSAEPINSATVTVTDSHGNQTDRIDITLDEPISAYDGKVLSGYSIITGADVAVDVPHTLTVTAINGNETSLTHPVTQTFYVSHDAFNRVPLVEEFTSMTCVNCPFMFYYLEEALHNFGQQYVYVSHHSGFNYDVFTSKVDRDMEYMFAGNKRNPTMMVDRTIWPGFGGELMVGATSENNGNKYLSILNLALHTPALASVNVSANDETITVSGRVGLGDKTTDGNVVISTYLIEDGLSTDIYPQEGITSNMADDAPADLREKFRHNGIIRVNLSTASMGDTLDIDADGYYSVSYPAPEFNKLWKRENCHYVSILHRNSESDLRDNIVLNAGDSRPFDPNSIPGVTVAAKGKLKVFVDNDGRINVVSPAVSVKVCDINGRTVDPSSPLPNGIYVVAAVLPDGTSATAKVAVR